MNAKQNIRSRRLTTCALTIALATAGSIAIATTANAAPTGSLVVATTSLPGSIVLPGSTVVSPDGVAQIRSGPGVRFDSVGQLQNGNRVTVLETQDGWSRVGINQWVASWLLRPGDAIPSNPIWRVQIGASQTKSRADSVAAAARAKGFQTFIRRVDGWYRVQVGAFAVRANADSMVTRARNAGFSDAFARTD